MHDGFEQRLRSLDVRLFDAIGHPGWRRDPISLLAVHAACREAHGTFAYLEIGSYLGSSLQSFIADYCCTSIVSIDPRPESVPDDRWGSSHYHDNTTERMLSLLDSVAGADLGKLVTFEADAADVGLESLPAVPQLCFVDGEHTYDAALSDARFCLRALRGEGAILFHDRAVVASAIAGFMAELAREGVPFVGYALPSVLFVVELGEPQLLRREPVRRWLGSRRVRFWRLANSGQPARRLGYLLIAEARLRRSTPGWLKLALATTGIRKATADGPPKGPSGVEPSQDVASERAHAASGDRC